MAVRVPMLRNTQEAFLALPLCMGVSVSIVALIPTLARQPRHLGPTASTGIIRVLVFLFTALPVTPRRVRLGVYKVCMTTMLLVMRVVRLRCVFFTRQAGRERLRRRQWRMLHPWLTVSEW
jgi:hypothetical protein